MSNPQPAAETRSNEQYPPQQARHPLVMLVLILAILLVMCSFRSSPTTNWNTLPSARTLIWLSESACRQHERRTGNKSDWPLQVLANAQAYSGDLRRATRNAHSLSEPWNAAALTGYLRIQFELTENAAEAPELLDLLPPLPDGPLTVESEFTEFSNVHTRVEIAKTVAIAGHAKQARNLLVGLPKDVSTVSMLIEFHLAAADTQIHRGDTSEVAESLGRCFKLVERPSEFSVKQGQRMLNIADLWLRLNNRDEAERVAVATEGVIREINKDGSAFSFMAKDAAKLGQFWAAIGDRDRAAESFREALRLADAAYEHDLLQGGDRFREMHLNYYAETLGTIAALQFSAGWKKDAAAVIELAIALHTPKGDPNEFMPEIETDSLIGNMLTTILLQRIRDNRGYEPPKRNDDRDFQLLKLVKLQGDAGDFEGAMKTMSQMAGDSWKGMGYCHCGKAAAKIGAPIYQQLLAEAESLAETASTPQSRASIFSDIAESRAMAGDNEGARRDFASAFNASHMTKANDNHSHIARAQVRVGLFEEAFRVLGEISEHESCLLPLAELARAVAKKEALARHPAAMKSSEKPASP